MSDNCVDVTIDFSIAFNCIRSDSVLAAVSASTPQIYRLCFMLPISLFVCLFVCLLLNGTSALFRPLVPRIVEVEHTNRVKNDLNCVWRSADWPASWHISISMPLLFNVVNEQSHSKRRSTDRPIGSLLFCLTVQPLLFSLASNQPHIRLLGWFYYWRPIASVAADKWQRHYQECRCLARFISELHQRWSHLSLWWFFPPTVYWFPPTFPR